MLDTLQTGIRCDLHVEYSFAFGATQLYNENKPLNWLKKNVLLEEKKQRKHL